MITLADLERDLVENVCALGREATKVFQDLVLLNWEGEFHGFGRTLHAYMMSGLAHVDLASTYWRGNDGNQTSRMRAFLVDRLGTSVEASKVLVKMWRHVLMHTGKPRRTVYAGGHYSWLLQWSNISLARITYSSSTAPPIAYSTLDSCIFLKICVLRVRRSWPI